MSDGNFDSIRVTANFLKSQFGIWTAEEKAFFNEQVGIALSTDPRRIGEHQDQAPAQQLSENAQTAILDLSDFDFNRFDPNFDHYASPRRTSESAATSPWSVATVADDHVTSPNADSKSVHGSQDKKKDRRTKKMNTRNNLPSDNRRARKGVNAFMAFRAANCVLFSSMEQKSRSKLISELWAYDPFKREWTVAASAYSIIRNEVGKENAPIKPFLDLVLPYIGIPSPTAQGSLPDYLTAIGWILDTEAGALVKPLQFLSRDYFDIRENITEKDIIAHCHANGYPNQVTTEPAASTSMTMTMTSAAQPVEETVMMPQTIMDNVNFSMDSMYGEQDFSQFFTLDGSAIDQSVLGMPEDMLVNYTPDVFWN